MPPLPAVPPDFLRAVRRRDALRADGQTDALRLLDGAGDGAAFAGWYVDDFAGRWLVQTSRPGQEPPQYLRGLFGAGSDAPRSIYWKQLDARDQHQRPPVHWAGEVVAAPFTVRENGLAYHLDFGGGYSQGIFLDQRDNRLALRRRMRPGMAVLNCFAYTGAFSVAAAAGGARTTSVDLSRRSLDWGRENFRLNGLVADGGEHHFLAGDVFDWLRRLTKQERRFDAVVLDPPTFSRDRKGRVFRVGDDFGGLAALAAPLLAPEGALLCSSNARGLTTTGFRQMILAGLPPASNGWQISPAPMPPDFTGEHYLQAAWFQRGGS